MREGVPKRIMLTLTISLGMVITGCSSIHLYDTVRFNACTSPILSNLQLLTAFYPLQGIPFKNTTS